MSPLIKLIIVVCLSIGINFDLGNGIPFQHHASAANSYVPTNQYERRNLEGWTVLINKHLLTDQAELGRQALTLLENRLRGLKQVVPPHAVSRLMEVPIWLGVNDGHAPCSEYHPSAQWLSSHGYNPDKAKAVEIGNAELFVKWSLEQPMLLLHEMAHAYQDRVLGWENEQIKAAYSRALQKGLYQSVPRSNGTMCRAYALTNEREYFAECSEAYFGRNDYYPFTRHELQRYDPDMAGLLREMWWK